MSLLNGLKIAICQMNVIPGRPDLNTDYIASEIKKAAARGVDVILFPELSTTGYFIGDLFENEPFVVDTIKNHKKILEATRDGIAAIFGSIIPARRKTGENGFFRLFNAAIIYSSGSYAGRAIKTLLPNYRMFDDSRHFYSNRQLAEELSKPTDELLEPVQIKTRNGQTLSLGITLCEDIWDGDYTASPANVLVNKGAEIICNLSASPWTWQKNRKRNLVVRELNCGVPLIYVNNTGTQNTSKNIVVFDGNSTVYNEEGLPIFEVGPYKSETADFVYDEKMPVLPEIPPNDDKELFDAVKTGVGEFFKNIPPQKGTVFIGLSGGIDSATTAALYTHVLGKENVFGISMPMPTSNPRLQDAAKKLAENLDIRYEVIPIGNIVSEKVKMLGIEEGSLVHENVQARTRMDILATRAQQTGGFFTANFNKVEQAFGYGTLGGDMEGCLAILGDMVKREVYQLADHMNKEVYEKPVIPGTSFNEPPTADLRPGQKDPFDYGNTTRRGYHDEMVRAFTDFRRDPEWFLKAYKEGRLESELKLEPGTIKRLFPSSIDFVIDLEKHWNLLFSSYFKRIQAPPILIVSRRSFGEDLRESMITAHFTKSYQELKEEVLTNPRGKVVVYGGSFNPPSIHHLEIVTELAETFETVVVVPCGQRKDKASSNLTSPEDRREMAKRAFDEIPNIQLDLSDLDNDTFTPTYLLDRRYKEKFPDKEIWHAVGTDIIKGGAKNNSEIQRSWHKGEEVWKGLNFIVMLRRQIELEPGDLPPRSYISSETGSLFGSSTMIRERISEGLEVRGLVPPKVWEYIAQKKLYGHG